MDNFISNLQSKVTPEMLILGFVILTGFILLQFLIIFILIIQSSKIKKRIKKFLPDDKNMNIQDMLIEYNNNVIKMLENQENILNKIESNKQDLTNDIDSTKKLIYLTNEKLKNAVQKVGIVRYNPFDEVGGDFCYAIALLDDYSNGVVLNSIYSREACYNYAKEIINGESPKHKLSDEEMEALKIAMNK